MERAIEQLTELLYAATQEAYTLRDQNAALLREIEMLRAGGGADPLEEAARRAIRAVGGYTDQNGRRVKMIEAIKVLRAEARLPLKESKDAIEKVWPNK